MDLPHGNTSTEEALYLCRGGVAVGSGGDYETYDGM